MIDLPIQVDNSKQMDIELEELETRISDFLNSERVYAVGACAESPSSLARKPFTSHKQVEVKTDTRS